MEAIRRLSFTGEPQQIFSALSLQFPVLKLHWIRSGWLSQHCIIGSDETPYRVQFWQFDQNEATCWAIELNYGETTLAFWATHLPQPVYPPLVWGQGLEPDEWINSTTFSQKEYRSILLTVRQVLPPLQ